MNIYKVKENNLNLVNYEKVLENDFLILKENTKNPYLNETLFNLSDLEKAFTLCDWKYSFHGKLILGFLIQSFLGPPPKRFFKLF